MKKNRKDRKITKYTLKKASEHVYYEVWMFYETLAILTNPIDQLTMNIVLDAFAIHCRNVFDFLYPKKTTKPDDIIVTDYISENKQYSKNITKKSELKFVIRKADKQVVHLTYSRNKYNSTTKPWPFADIGRKMWKSLNAFYISMPKGNQGFPHFIHLRSVLDKYKNL